MCVILSAKTPSRTEPVLADKEVLLTTLNIKAMAFTGMEDTNDSSGMDAHAPCQLISWFLLLRTPVNDSSWKTDGLFHLYQWVVECRVLEGILSPILWKMKENCLPLQSIWIIPGWFIRGWWGRRNQYPDNKRQHHKPGKLAQTQVTFLQEKNSESPALILQQ